MRKNMYNKSKCNIGILFRLRVVALEIKINPEATTCYMPIYTRMTTYMYNSLNSFLLVSYQHRLP